MVKEIILDNYDATSGSRYSWFLEQLYQAFRDTPFGTIVTVKKSKPYLPTPTYVSDAANRFNNKQAPVRLTVRQSVASEDKLYLVQLD